MPALKVYRVPVCSRKGYIVGSRRLKYLFAHLTSVILVLGLVVEWQTAAECSETPPASWEWQQPGTRVRIGRQYTLKEYGFTVRIPAPIRAYGPYCFPDGICGPTHGFTGSISSDKDAEVYVFAEHNPWFGQPAKPVMPNSELQEYVLSGSHPSGTALSAVASQAATLDNLPAIRVTAKYRKPGSKDDTSLDIIFALRSLPGDDSILYRIVLEAPSSRYETDRPIFNSLIKAFKLVRIRG